jgi:phage shock protein C
MQAQQLNRSQTDRRIGGVCGGIAEYFDIDPTLIRIAFVAAALLSGVGILLYIVLWMVLPAITPFEPPQPSSH